MKDSQQSNAMPPLHNLEEQLSDIKLQIALLEAARVEDEANLAQFNALPKDAPERSAEQAFHDRMEPKIHGLIRGLHRKERNRQLLRSARRVLRVAAAIFLVACIGLGTAMAVSSELRVTVMKLLYNVTPQYTEIRLVSDESAAFNIPGDWMGEFYPSYIPDGYILRSIQGTRFTMDVTYDAPGDKVLIFAENHAAVETNVNTEGYEVRQLELNGSTALLAVKDGETTVVWQQDNKALYLTISENVETALQVVTGVRRIIK
ncbi:MAG: DUF4367 domain-containing protein [Christensenellales bacterium]|jgi:hypothetical protein